MRRPVTDSGSSDLSKEQTHKFRIYSVCGDCQQMARAFPSQEHDTYMASFTALTELLVSEVWRWCTALFSVSCPTHLIQHYL